MRNMDFFDKPPHRLPDFYILGGPKCGTTSLFAWLRQHPDTFLPAKEPNFLSRDIFDPSSIPGAIQDWGEYLRRLTPVQKAGAITGEATPRSLYSDEALEILAHHPSKPKLIAILRNPINLVHSLHGQMVREGVESETDFARAWERALNQQDDPTAWIGTDGRVDRRLDYPALWKDGSKAGKVEQSGRARTAKYFGP